MVLAHPPLLAEQTTELRFAGQQGASSLSALVCESPDFKAELELVWALESRSRSASLFGYILRTTTDWCFAVASRQLDAAGPTEAYGLVHDAPASAGISLEQTPALTLSIRRWTAWLDESP